MISDARRLRTAATRLTMRDLPAVAAHEITNQLYGAGGCSLGELTWCWESICPSRIQEWIVLAAGSEQLHLALDGDVVALEERQIDWRDYEGQTQLIAWTACHEPLLDLLRCLFRRDWVPERIGDCDAPALSDSLQMGFSVYRDDGLHIASGLTRFHTAHLPDLATQLAGAKPRHCHFTEQLHASLDVVVDEIAIECEELAALTPGCIVRIDNRTLLTARPRLVFAAGSNRLIADIDAASATVVSITAGSERITGERAMSNEPQAITADPDVTPESHGIETGALPVQLSFRAGSLTVPLRKLSQVGAGFVFELDKRLDDQVITIHANDTPVAVGELVALGDLIGVRVTRMLPKP